MAYKIVNGKLVKITDQSDYQAPPNTPTQGQYIPSYAPVAQPNYTPPPAPTAPSPIVYGPGPVAPPAPPTQPVITGQTISGFQLANQQVAQTIAPPPLQNPLASSPITYGTGAPSDEAQRLLDIGQIQVQRNLAAAALQEAPLVEDGTVNEAVRAAQAQRAGVTAQGPPQQVGEGAFFAGGSPAADQAAALIQRYQQAGITPPQNLLDARNQRVAPPYFAGFPGIPAGALQFAEPRERIVQKTSSLPSGNVYDTQINFQGEQAMLTPAAVLDAFFSGTDGRDWGYGAFYSGVNPEDRNPPAFFSPLTYSFLTNPADPSKRIDPALIAEFYEQDPVTGYWVRRVGSQDLPIDSGSGGYSNYPAYPSYAYPGYPGYGGSSGTPRAPSMGLVNWRI